LQQINISSIELKSSLLEKYSSDDQNTLQKLLESFNSDSNFFSDLKRANCSSHFSKFEINLPPSSIPRKEK
jgi:hypothetical protein